MGFFEEDVVEGGSEVEFLLASLSDGGCCSATSASDSSELPRIAIALTPFGAAEDAASLSRSAELVGVLDREFNRVSFEVSCWSCTSTLRMPCGSPLSGEGA